MWRPWVGLPVVGVEAASVGVAVVAPVTEYAGGPAGGRGVGRPGEKVATA